MIYDFIWWQVLLWAYKSFVILTFPDDRWFDCGIMTEYENTILDIKKQLISLEAARNSKTASVSRYGAYYLFQKTLFYSQ